jgi:hypothetical protein
MEKFVKDYNLWGKKPTPYLPRKKKTKTNPP